METGIELVKVKSDMWLTLITTLRKLTENNEISNFKLILNMIRTNLTFDDPGLFSIKNLSEERIKLEACNTWLFNLLMSCLVSKKLWKDMQIIIDLQKDILSASFVKQPWFFEIIIHKIIESINILANIKFPIKQTVNINVFQVKGFDMALIYPEFCYKSIEINSEEVKNNLLENCIELLSHSAILFIDFDENITNKCNYCIANALKTSNFKIKINCIQYYNNLFKKLTFINRDFKNQVLYLFYDISTILEKFLLFTNIPELPQFSEAVKRFFRNIQCFKIYKNFTDNKKIINICINMLKSIASNHENKIMIHLGECIIDFLIKIPKENGNIFKLNNLESNFSQFPDIIFLLELNVINELKENSTEIHLNAYEISCAWKNIYENLIESLNKLENGDYNWKSLNCHLLLVKMIMKSANCIEYNYNIWKQQQNMSLSHTHVSFFQQIRFDLDIGKSILNIVNLTMTSRSDTFEDLLDIARYFCGTYDFIYLDTATQTAFIHIVIGPFLKIIEYDKENEFFNKIISVTNQSIDSDKLFSIQMKSIDAILSLHMNLMTEECRENVESWIYKILCYVMVKDSFNIDIKNNIVLQSINIIINKLSTQTNNLLFNILKPAYQIPYLHFALTKILKNLLCMVNDKVDVIKVKTETNFIYNVLCRKCIGESSKLLNFNERQGIIIEISPNEDLRIGLQKSFEKYFTLIESEDKKVRINMVHALPSIFNHSKNKYNTVIWLKLFTDENLSVRLSFSNTIVSALNSIKNSKMEEIDKQKINEKCFQNLLQCIKVSLSTFNHPLQSCVINMILKLGTSELITQDNLVLYFKMTIPFIIHTKTSVMCEAILCAIDMCTKNNVSPMNILQWYKQEIVNLVLSLCVCIFLQTEISLQKSLQSVTKMFGFNGPINFISKNYKLIIAILLPHCVKNQQCESLLLEVSLAIQKDLPEALSISFLTIYPYLFINETTDVSNKCIEFVCRHTGSTLYQLLHSVIKRTTVAEILVYYHKSPDCVMQVLRSILSEGLNKEADVTVSKMTEYIATKFLGVLTFFEASLIDPETEKSIKREILLSLGEIIRFLGSNHITAFRFKILAMLKTAQAIDSELSLVCAKVWTIFIHTVDIEALGPLLSTIIVSLEPLLKIQADEVNAIFKYLVITNGSLLSVHIPDLFFLDDFNVSSEIKSVVKRQTEGTQSEQFIEKLYGFIKHINHENLGVRVYGLKYLWILLSSHRTELNYLIIGQKTLDPILEKILENLMVGCKHLDENLQLAAGKCLGELGAIEPSLISRNYAPQNKFALGIHTDLFAIMALDELCRAYQFQKDTKYVDSFSLAIQEILVERGVCPKNNKKNDVWQAIPERMRPLMEPLLTSSYTGFQNKRNIKIHPIFGSSECRSSDDWAFNWSSKMIEKVQDENTQHLLNSFIPSIKRNVNILSMFLPYIILHSLTSSDEDNQQKIVEEMSYVFSAVTRTETESKYIINKKRVRALGTISFLSTETTRRLEADINIGSKCAKLAFNQLDFFSQWLRQWSKGYSTSSKPDHYNIIENFMNKFDKKMIAEANFHCNEYARALLYIESYIEEKPMERLQEELSFLAKIYAELINPDSLEGAMCLKTTEPTLSEQILVHNVTGHLQESAACFERLMQVSDISVGNMKDVVQCYLGLDQPETALLMSEGLLRKIYGKNWLFFLEETRAELLWRLSRFDELEELTQITQIQESPNWGVKCGQLLLNIRKENLIGFEESLKRARLTVLKVLRTSGIEQNAYHKGYPLVMKLHFINEFESIGQIIKKSYNLYSSSGVNLLKDLFTDWDARLEVIQPTARLMEPVLCIRRILLMETIKIIEKNCVNKKNCHSLTNFLNEYIGKLWLKSTELARKAGMIQQAQLYIMNAENYKSKELFLEKAKLFWKKGEQSNTFKTLERGIKEMLDSTDISVRDWIKSDQSIYAEAKLLIATYNAESMNIETHLNLKYFKESVRAFKESEKGFVYLAQYLDKIYAALSEEEQQKDKGLDLLIEIIYKYGNSMLYGCHYIYQSMPRLLSIWFDFTAKMKKDDAFQKVAKNMNTAAEQFCEILPPFIFFTAFSQLVSRICHPSSDVYLVLKTILVKLIKHFPQQSLWMISSVFKSSYSSRVKRCSEIFQDKRLSGSDTQKLINDFNSLAEKLIELTNKDIPSNIQNPTVSSLVRSLPKLFTDSKFSQIVLPIQQHMQPILPAIGKRSSSAKLFNAFPNHLVYIQAIKEEVTILQSLQRPRKIILMGTDGKVYIVMMKPKDDLRKDFRLMEFNAVVKEYLHQDPDARQRRLNIRTYAVLPLNEECGIIEWVPNLQALRLIITSIYKQKNCTMLMQELKAAACDIHDSLSKKREVFINILVARHPAVFAEWFKNRFTTPHNWYQARCSYIKTTAVMSIVGYILGLGDRHGENILFDSTNGDTVHVDFNCLFNKGETFDYPEKVPFRLTHNMTHAMGPLGIEGLYRKCCEITLKILRRQTPTLMSVVKPFVYDPLVSWSRSSKVTQFERTDPQSMANVKHIEERLKGFVKINGKTSNMILSAEGQVNSIISEAINIDNLAAMYIGWGAYL